MTVNKVELCGCHVKGSFLLKEEEKEELLSG